MNAPLTYAQHVRLLLRLAFPVTLAQLGHITVGLADTYMAGKLGGVYLASATLAFSFFFPFLFFGIGISSGPSPLLAKAQGGHHVDRIRGLFWQSLYMNLITGVLLTALIYFSSTRIHYFNSDPVLLANAVPFLHILALSVLPTMIFQAFRQYAEGLSDTQAAMYISLGGTLVNVVLNWAFTQGVWGFPPMGLNGIGLGTLYSRIVMAMAMAAYVGFRPSLNRYLRGTYDKGFRRKLMAYMVRKSLPVGIQLSIESAVFALGAIFISRLGTVAIASHQIALNLAATSYMAATGLTAAVSVRVGYEWGAGRIREIRKAGLTAFALVSLFMLSVSLVFIGWRLELATLFVVEKDIIATTSSLLLIAALFQLADGLQVVGIGALRGIGDVVAPTLIALLAYWAIGLPIGYWLTFYQGMNVYGIWFGFTIGLFIAAFLMLVRFLLLVRKMEKEELLS